MTLLGNVSSSLWRLRYSCNLDYLNLDIIQLMTVHAMLIIAISVGFWAKPPTLCSISSFSGITG